MPKLLGDFVLMFLLVALSGGFAMSEVALLAARKARLRRSARHGRPGAARALALASAPETFLATAQIGITLVGIALGAIGEARIAEQIAPLLGRVEILRAHQEAWATVLVVALLTYVSVTIGELVPKQIGLRHAERIAIAVAGPMQLFARLTSPAVRFLGVSSRLVLRATSPGPHHEAPVSEEELQILIQEGTQAGVFEPAERRLLERALRLGDRRVSALMVPRADIAWLDLAVDEAENRRRVAEAAQDHFPVCRGDLQTVVGMISMAELWRRGPGSLDRLERLAQKPLYVPETTTSLKLLERFGAEHAHAALALDEYGAVVGLVSRDDLAVALLGEVAPLAGDAEPPVVKRADGSWLVDGGLTLHELHHVLGAHPGLPDAGADGPRTVGGLAMFCSGRIPQIGDQFVWGAYEFEIVDMDGRRVDRVLVRRSEPSGETTPEAAPPA